MRDGAAGEPDSLLQQQPFFLHLLRRNSALSSPSPSAYSIAHHTPALVPFLWESSPGLPKPYPAPTSQDLASPRLPPPPVLQSPGILTHHRPRLPPVSPRHSFSSKVKNIIRRQRSSSLDVLECVNCSDVPDRKDKMRPSKSISSGLTVRFEEATAGRSRNYHSNLEPDCALWSHQDETIFSPGRKHASAAVVPPSSVASVSRGLFSVSPSSLMNRHSDSNCSYATLSTREQPGSSEVVSKMPNQNDVHCPKNSAAYSNSCSAFPENSSSALDQQFSCLENVFPGEDLTYHTKIGDTRIGSVALDKNVAELASEVQFPLEFAATSESKRSSTSMEDEGFPFYQDSAGLLLNKHRKSYSLDTIFASFNTIQGRHSRGVHFHGASNELPQVKDKRSPTSKSKPSCLPKLCSTSQRCAVAPSKSISRGGI